MDNHMARPTLFRPLLCDTAYLGVWKPVTVDFDTSGLTEEEVDAIKSQVGSFPDNMTFEVRREGSASTYTIYECYDGKRSESPPTVVQLDGTVANPIGVGRATTALSDSGAAGTITFAPHSADWAVFTLDMTSEEHHLIMTVTLSRVRTPRPVIR
jgi:hypothetical protein